MKILIFINSLGAGGAERSMVEFAKFLNNEKDVSVKFVCLKHKKIGLEEEVEASGLETIYFEGEGGFISKILFLNRIINKENPDIIHSVLAETNFVLRFSRLFLRKAKVVQSLVSTPYSLERKKDNKLSWKKFQLVKSLDKWTARITPDIFYHAITKEVYEHYKYLFNIKDNFKIIYRGRYENMHIGLISKKDIFVLINVGRQEFAKGQIDILKALLYLREEHNVKNIKLEILGRPGQSSVKLNNFILENKMSDQVKIEGFVSDVASRLVNSHVFIFPSYYEGLGGALIEAFSAKLPCICSDIPVLREVVGKEDGALFSPPGDYKELAENILKLYRNEELRNKLSTHSYSRFQEAFRMETINKEMLNMYKEILGSK